MDSARRRWLIIGLALPCLALAGAPLTSGMVTKAAIVAGETILPEPWARVTQILLPLTSVATALLMARFLVLMNVSPAGAKPPAGRGPWLIWSASLLLVLLLPLWLAPAAEFSWTMRKLTESLWPLLAALLLALIAIRIWRQVGRPSVPEIPAGDVLLPMEQLTLKVQSAATSVIEQLRVHYERVKQAGAAGRGRAWALIQSTSGVEALLNRWRVAVTLALLVGAALAWLAA